MFDDQNQADYLSESAGSISDTPIKYPAIEPVKNPPKMRQVLPHEDQYEPYWKRADVAPFSRHYDEPRRIPQSFDVDTSMGYISEDAKASNFKSGILMSSMIILGAVAGYSLEDKLSSQIKAAGYGSLIGAVAANGIRYGLSNTLSSGIAEGFRSLLGASIPLIPIGIAMLTKKPLKKEMVTGLGIITGLMGSYVIYDTWKTKAGF